MSRARSAQLVCLVVLAVVSHCMTTSVENFLDEPSHEEFEQFKQRFDKVYESDEHHSKGKANYHQNRMHIIKHQMSDSSAQYGHTIFSDMSPEEFAAKHLNFNYDMFEAARHTIPRKSPYATVSALLGAAANSDERLPKSFDWREKGIITPAKFQDTCGSCWTFATTGIIESQYALKYGQLIPFSEQMLLDCDRVNQGCRGGLMTEAYKYLQKSGGISTAADYGTYQNKVEECRFDKSKVKARVVDWYQLPESEDLIQRELVKSGPIAVGINARQLQFYDGGVLDPADCNNQINHAVLLVGYGETANGQKYWIVKNQWGKNWGDQGFFKLARGKRQCGVHTYASIAFVEKVR